MTECHEVCDDWRFISTKEFLQSVYADKGAYEQMYCRFEGAMGFHCNREATLQMTKRRLVSA